MHVVCGAPPLDDGHMQEEEEEAAVRAGTIPWSLHLPPKAAETMVGVRQRLADASAARARAQEEAAAAAAMMALQGAPLPNDAVRLHAWARTGPRGGSRMVSLTCALFPA